MKKLSLIVVFFVIGLLRLALAEIPPHPEYNADMISTNKKGKIVSEGKIYIGKAAGKLDMTMGKNRQIQFFRFDSSKITHCMPENQSCMEMTMDFNAFMNQDWKGWNENCSGEETIDGHPCKVCQIEGKFLGKTRKSTIWKAQDLMGTVVKTLDEKGNKMELKNVAQGPQPDELFIPPAEYRKIGLPGDMGKALKGLFQ